MLRVTIRLISGTKVNIDIGVMINLLVFFIMAVKNGLLMGYQDEKVISLHIRNLMAIKNGMTRRVEYIGLMISQL